MTQPVTSGISVPPGSRSLSDEARLRKAAQQMEGLFLSHLIKVMRSAGQGKEQSGMAGKDVMGDYADMELGRVLAERRGIGLSEVLYKSLRNATGKLAEVERSLDRPAPMLPVRRGTTARPLNQDARPYDIHVRRAARHFELNPRLIHSVIQVESAGNAHAISPKSAKGLMQLTDSTAQMLGVSNVWDPAENIHGGAKYLRQLLDRFDGDLRQALAAYNAGPAAVERYGGVPPYEETKIYVERVLDCMWGRPDEVSHE